MQIKIILQNSENGDLYDISTIVSNIEIKTYISGQPGTMQFDIIRDVGLVLNEGSRVLYKVNDVGIFYGYIFKLQTDETGKTKVTCYDQLRYLKNKDFYLNKGETLSETFAKVCDKYNLKYQIVDGSDYKATPKIFDNKTLYEVLQYSIDENIRNTGKYFIIRDNFGVLELRDITRLKTPYVIGDASLLSKYKFERTIDKQTYNQVKITQENKKEFTFNTVVQFDSDNQKRWGILQYYRSASDKATTAEIEDLAANLLKLYNREGRNLSVDIIPEKDDMGIFELIAGSGFYLNLKTAIDKVDESKGAADETKKDALEKKKAAETTKGWYWIDSAVHSMKNEQHKISLRVVEMI